MKYDKEKHYVMLELKKIINELDKNIEYMYLTGRNHFRKAVIKDTDEFVEDLRTKWIICKTEVLK